jgi:hypothetical protein
MTILHQSRQAANPQVFLGILKHHVYIIVAHGVGVLIGMTKGGKLLSVESIQAIFSRHPDKPE